MQSMLSIWATLSAAAVLFSSFADASTTPISSSSPTTPSFTSVSTNVSSHSTMSEASSSNPVTAVASTPSASSLSAETTSPSSQTTVENVSTGPITAVTTQAPPATDVTTQTGVTSAPDVSIPATSGSQEPASATSPSSDATTVTTSPSELNSSASSMTANDSSSTSSVTSETSFQSSSDASVSGSSSATSTPSAAPSDSTTATVTFPAADTSTSATPPPSSPATTPTPATTSWPAPHYPTAQPSEFYVANLSIDQSSTSGHPIYCEIECNETALLQEIKRAFARIPFFVTVRPNSINSLARRKRAVTTDGLLQFQVVFDAKILISISAEQRLITTQEALGNITTLNTTSFSSSTFYRALVNVTLTCQTGFTYKTGFTCQSLCEDFYSKCGEHGDCKINIDLTSRAALPYCLCKEDSDYEYSGPTCSESRMNRSKVIQIVAGVLGAFSGLCLVIIVVLVCLRCRDDDNKYSFGGYTNNGYSNGSSDIDMMKMSA